VSSTSAPLHPRASTSTGYFFAVFDCACARAHNKRQTNSADPDSLLLPDRAGRRLRFCRDGTHVMSGAMFENMQRILQEASLPAVRIVQPGEHLHDQRHSLVPGGELYYPAWVLESYGHSSALTVVVEVLLSQQMPCGSFALELSFGTDRGEEPKGAISKSACDLVGGGTYTRGEGGHLELVFPLRMHLQHVRR